MGPLGVRSVQGLKDGQEDGQGETVEGDLFLIGHGAELFQLLPVKLLAAAEALHIRVHEVHHKAHTGDDQQGDGHHAQGPVDEIDVVPQVLVEQAIGHHGLAAAQRGGHAAHAGAPGHSDEDVRRGLGMPALLIGIEAGVHQRSHGHGRDHGGHRGVAHHEGRDAAQEEPAGGLGTHAAVDAHEEVQGQTAGKAPAYPGAGDGSGADDEDGFTMHIGLQYLAQRHVAVHAGHKDGHQAGQFDVNDAGDPPEDHPEQDAEAEAGFDGAENGHGQGKQQQGRPS